MNPSNLRDELSCSWTIALTTPFDTLFVYRLMIEKEISAMSLVEVLVDEGIRFLTLQPLMVTMTASMRTVPVLNPIVLRGTSSTSLIIICMFKIEQGFSRLLRTCGITGRRNSWSNFKEHLGYDSAALGPSTAVTVYCKGFYFTDSMHTTYWNDKLTDDEMHIICGSYH